jgi:hypothetical protein
MLQLSYRCPKRSGSTASRSPTVMLFQAARHGVGNGPAPVGKRLLSRKWPQVRCFDNAPAYFQLPVHTARH